MSDVITLDSSDEESPPVQKKPKLKIQAKKKLSVPQQAPLKVASQQMSSKGTTLNVPIQKGNSLNVPIQIANANSTPKIQTMSNPFSDELRKKVRSIVSGIRAGHAPVNIRPLHNPKSFPCNISVQNPMGSLLQPIRAVNHTTKRANVPIRPQGNINPMNKTNLPFILNARSLQKPAAQNVINTLPAGITVTRTSTNKMPTQKPLMQNVIVKTPLPKKKRPPPKVMETVELDDDEEDLGGNTDIVGAQIPIEFDFAGAEDLAGDDTKENSSFVIEVPPKEPIEGNEEKTYELTLTNGDSLDNESEDVSNDQETSTLEEPESLDVTEEVELAVEFDPLKTNLLFYTPRKYESKESPSSKEIHNDKIKKNLENFIEILDSPIKEKVLEEVAKVPEEIKTIKEEITAETITKDVKDVDFPIPSPKKDIIVFIPDTSLSSVLDEKKPVSPKEVEIKINIRLEDVLEVQEFIKKSPVKRIAPTPVVETERQINETYQSLIDLCFKLDSSDDMKKIIDKKVKAYYLSVQPSFTESKSFCKFVQGKVEEISDNPDCLFLYIKDVVDELKVRRVKNKKNFQDDHKSPGIKNRRLRDLQDADTRSTESEGGESHEEEEDSVLNERIHKLERAMRKLSKAIKKLDEREIEDNDEENSAYMLGDRYKSRLVRIYNKLCVLTGERNEARQVACVRGLSRLSLCGGRLPRLSAAVKAAAAAKPHWFPDYLDVFRCVEHCAKEQGLDMRPDMLHSEAREAFLEIGTLLQQRRRAQEYEDLSWRLGMHSDPAEHDPELAAKLAKNRELSKHREMEVLNKFAEKQSNLKLVAEDVPDNDADKSEGSSEDSEEEETCDTKEDDEGEASSTTRTKDATGKSKEGSISPRDKNKEDPTIANSEEAISEEPDKQVEIKSEGNTELVRDLQLEKQSSKEEQPRKRKFREDSNDSSSMSLIELSSSDSQNSLKSDHEPEKKRQRTEGDRDFKRLESIRPSSAMSGINLIEDGSSSCSRFASNKDSLEDDRFKSITASDSNDVIMEVEDSNDVSEAPIKPAREDVTNHVDDNAMDQVQNLVDNEKTEDFCTKDSLQVIDNESNDCSLSSEPNQIKIGNVQSLQNHDDPDETIDDEDEDVGNTTLVQSNDINNLLEVRCSEVSDIGDEVHAISPNVADSDIETDSESVALFYDEKDSEGTDDVYKTVVASSEEIAAVSKGVVDVSSSNSEEIPNGQQSKAVQEEEADDTLCEEEADVTLCEEEADVTLCEEEDTKISQVEEVKGSEDNQGVYEGEIDIFEHEITGAA